MIHLPASVRVYLCLSPCDMRKSFDSLHALVREQLQLDAFAGYDRELESIATEQGWFHYVPIISRIWLDVEWKGERGRAEDVVRKYQDAFGFRPANTTAYVCGNPNLVENVRGLLKRGGFPKESVREEMFWLPEKAELPSGVSVGPGMLQPPPAPAIGFSAVPVR